MMMQATTTDKRGDQMSKKQPIVTPFRKVGKYEVLIETLSNKRHSEQFNFIIRNLETGEETKDGIYDTPYYYEVYEEHIEPLLV
jgi:hypothetical protein